MSEGSTGPVGSPVFDPLREVLRRERDKLARRLRLVERFARAQVVAEKYNVRVRYSAADGVIEGRITYDIKDYLLDPELRNMLIDTTIMVMSTVVSRVARGDRVEPLWKAHLVVSESMPTGDEVDDYIVEETPRRINVYKLIESNGDVNVYLVLPFKRITRKQRRANDDYDFTDDYTRL